MRGRGRIRHSYLCTKHYLYPVWASMLDRCFNPNNADWLLYGGRGIKVYKDWWGKLGSSRQFIDWVEANLGPRPVSYTLDRIDKNGHYEPGNLRWSSAKEQCFNRRSTIQVVRNGTPMSLFAALTEIGLSSSQAKSVWVRLRRGMTLTEAVFIYGADVKGIIVTAIPPKRKMPTRNGRHDL